MVTLGMLWLPILVASVIVFIAGYIMNMVLPHHRSDFSRLPDEDAVSAAVRGLPQGQYGFPHASTPAEMKDPAYVERVKAGPVGMLVIWPNSTGPSAKQLGIHFVFLLVISLFAGYVASASVASGTEYLKIFQIVGTVSWMGYAGATFLNSIWYHAPWSVTLKLAFDGLVYALLTAGVFGWLWP
ncbi:MAG: hypothetical protein ACE5G0_03500 [Rhodothermales bacterium]